MINTLKSAPLGEERFEVKFAGASSARDVMDAWIRTHRAGFIKPYPSRRVNSTYFDTHSLRAYEENLIGASLREKVRNVIEADNDSRVVDLHIWSIGPAIYSAQIALVAHQPLAPTEYKDLIPTSLGLVHVSIEINICTEKEITA